MKMHKHKKKSKTINKTIHNHKLMCSFFSSDEREIYFPPHECCCARLSLASKFCLIAQPKTKTSLQSRRFVFTCHFRELLRASSSRSQMTNINQTERRQRRFVLSISNDRRRFSISFQAAERKEAEKIKAKIINFIHCTYSQQKKLRKHQTQASKAPISFHSLIIM